MPPTKAKPPKPPPRHAAAVRLTHWVNAVALFFLLASGLQIFNAHPALYWGEASTFSSPWLAMGARERDGELIGLTRVGPAVFETTGLFGASERNGSMERRGFPAWSTMPSWRSLADGRIWHFAFAWLFVLNGLAYLAWTLLSGHLRRDLAPRRGEFAPRQLAAEIAAHARLRFPKAKTGGPYNPLQKLAYLGLIFGLLPLMVVTGLCMSPAINAAVPWLTDLFGGRQSARSIHFLCAAAILAFVAVHLAMVLAAGPISGVRAMVTGGRPRAGDPA